MVVDGLVDILVFVPLPRLDAEDEPFLSEGKLEETPGNDIWQTSPVYLSNQVSNLWLKLFPNLMEWSPVQW